VAAAPVTVREFRQFLKDTQLQAWFESGEEFRGQVASEMKRYSPDENGPIISPDWYMAAAYCNWLSKVEGIHEDQWCYETNSEQKVTALKKGYLSLRGYRLPTEGEMEYACRAGAVTSRYYGETEELLVNYGWYRKNSKERAWPVGSKKPNDLGIFDMHGNVFNWCQGSYQGPYPISEGSKVFEDKEDSLQIRSTTGRVLRGGWFSNHAVNVRSALRSSNLPTTRLINAGLRPARTFTP
jgi:formylglycine-generating enzyme required for sulfatase activity